MRFRFWREKGTAGPHLSVSGAERSISGGDTEAYWSHFRQRVLRAAGPELHRRRTTAWQPGVLEVLFAWRRRLAPAAMGVALGALAMVFGVSGEGDASPQPQPTPQGVVLEELLLGGSEEGEESDERLQRLRGEGEMNADEVFYAVESTP